MFRCIVADYDTWRQKKLRTDKEKCRMLRLRAYGRSILPYVDGKADAWEFFENRTKRACREADNTHGKLRQLVVYYRVEDEDAKYGYRDIAFVQQDGGNRTYAVPADKGITERKDFIVETTDKPIQLTADFIRGMAPKLLKLLHKKEAGHQRTR